MAKVEILKVQLAEVEVGRSKAVSDLKVATAELETQYSKGYEDAGDHYEDQLFQVFREGWRAALRKLAFDKSFNLWTEVPIRDEADLRSDGEAEEMDEDPKNAELQSTEVDVADPPNAGANLVVDPSL